MNKIYRTLFRSSLYPRRGQNNNAVRYIKEPVMSIAHPGSWKIRTGDKKVCAVTGLYYSIGSRWVCFLEIYQDFEKNTDKREGGVKWKFL